MVGPEKRGLHVVPGHLERGAWKSISGDSSRPDGVGGPRMPPRPIWAFQVAEMLFETPSAGRPCEGSAMEEDQFEVGHDE